MWEKTLNEDRMSKDRDGKTLNDSEDRKDVE
jgi:hypothetical protein